MQQENNTPVNFAGHLALLLEARGLTQKRFAEAVGVSQASVVKWLKGSMPLGDTLSKVASFFGMHPDYLLHPKKYRDHINRIATETEDLPGSQDHKDAEFNRRIIREAAKLKNRQDGFESAMKVFTEAEREELREAREKLARVKKLLQQALAEL